MEEGVLGALRGWRGQGWGVTRPVASWVADLADLFLWSAGGLRAGAMGLPWLGVNEMFFGGREPGCKEERGWGNRPAASPPAAAFTYLPSSHWGVCVCRKRGGGLAKIRFPPLFCRGELEGGRRGGGEQPGSEAPSIHLSAGAPHFRDGGSGEWDVGVGVGGCYVFLAFPRGRKLASCKGGGPTQTFAPPRLFAPLYQRSSFRNE